MTNTSSFRDRRGKKSHSGQRAAGSSIGRRRWLPWLFALSVTLAAWGGVELVRARTRLPVEGPAAGGLDAGANAAPSRPIRTWRVAMGAVGPWGRLEYTRISIEPPESFLPKPEVYGTPEWFFPDQQREEVEAGFRAVRLPPDQLDGLLGRSTWTVSEDGTVVKPPVDVVTTLPAAARASLYAMLSNFRGNVFQRTPTIVRPEFLEERLETSGLSPRSVGLFKQMLYRRGSWTLFSDVQALLHNITDPAEQQRAIGMTLRTSTFMVRLKLDDRSDLASIARYWDYPGRAKDLEPLLRSLTRVDGGFMMDVAHLLPPMPRRRIYTYPRPDPSKTTSERDCYWTTLNFFRDIPDEAFTVAETAIRALREEYEVVERPSAYGDVVLMSNGASGQPVHAAIYLADDLLFTKNGRSSRQPWMLMKMDDATSYYAYMLPESGRLVTKIFRRRIQR